MGGDLSLPIPRATPSNRAHENVREAVERNLVGAPVVD